MAQRRTGHLLHRRNKKLNWCYFLFLFSSSFSLLSSPSPCRSLISVIMYLNFLFLFLFAFLSPFYLLFLFSFSFFSIFIFLSFFLSPSSYCIFFICVYFFTSLLSFFFLCFGFSSFLSFYMSFTASHILLFTLVSLSSLFFLLQLSLEDLEWRIFIWPLPSYISNQETEHGTVSGALSWPLTVYNEEKIYFHSSFTFYIWTQRQNVLYKKIKENQSLWAAVIIATKGG